MCPCPCLCLGLGLASARHSLPRRNDLKLEPIAPKTLSQLRLSSPLALLRTFPPNTMPILTPKIPDATIPARQATITLDLAESAIIADLAALFLYSSRH